MRFRTIALAFTLLFSLSVCLPAAAHADPVLYTFTATRSTVGPNFTYLSTSGFLNFGPIPYAPTAGELVFMSYGLVLDLGKVSGFTFLSPTSVEIGAEHGPFAFSSPGYVLDEYGLQPGPTSANYDGFTLDIEPAVAPIAVTPEPSSFALLGTGLLGVVGALRKRPAHAA